MRRITLFTLAVLFAFHLAGGCPQSGPVDEGEPANDSSQSTPDSPTNEPGADSTPTGDSAPTDDPAAAISDSDFDGIPDGQDAYPFDPFNNDLDFDGVSDDVDNCFLYNPDQADLDGSGFGDLCEAAIVLAASQPPPSVIGTALVAYDGQFLGYVDDNPFNSASIANSFGTYGNPFSRVSIWNPFGTYGNSFSSLSPWNSFTSTPPLLVENGRPVAYVTTNSFLSPRIHPNDLAVLVGRLDEIR